MPICTLFLIWPGDSLYCQISLFLSMFWTFEADLRGLFMLYKYLKKIYTQNIPNKLKFTSICSDDQGGFVTHYDHCAVIVLQSTTSLQDVIWNVIYAYICFGSK